MPWGARSRGYTPDRRTTGQIYRIISARGDRQPAADTLAKLFPTALLSGKRFDAASTFRSVLIPRANSFAYPIPHVRKVSALCQRMTGDMTVSNFAPNTQDHPLFSCGSRLLSQSKRCRSRSPCPTATGRRTERKRPRPRLNSRDRLFWTALRQCWSRWRDVLVLVKPEPVVGWRLGFRLYWRWRSRPLGGRPTMAQENQHRVAPAIHELQKLGLSSRSGWWRDICAAYGVAATLPRTG
jgi:hypothetical protein